MFERTQDLVAGTWQRLISESPDCCLWQQHCVYLVIAGELRRFVSMFPISDQQAFCARGWSVVGMTKFRKAAATTRVRMGSTESGKLTTERSSRIAEEVENFNSLALVYWISGVV